MKSLILNFSELKKKNIDLSYKIGKSLSNTGNGFIIIRDIPDFEIYREKLFVLGNKFLNSSDDILHNYRSKSAKYYLGYSDTPFVTDDGVKHLNFNSFVARPISDTVKSNKYKDFEEGFKNIWPDDYLPEFKSSFQNLGKIVSTCQFHLFDHVCVYLKDLIPNFQNDIQTDLSKNIDVVSRLINYYPRKVVEKNILDGWHTDYSLFTAITHPMFLENSKKIDFNQTCLKILDRSMNEVELVMNENDLLIFPSNSFHILSGGIISATPHVVELNRQKSNEFNCNRVTLATFFQPNPDYIMKLPSNVNSKENIKFPPHMNEFFENNISYQEYSDFLLNYLITRKEQKI